MEESTSREKIFKNIRDALINKSDNPYKVTDWSSSVFAELEDSPDVSFASEFTRIGGKFIYCDHEKDFAASFQQLQKEMGSGITYCLESNIKGIFDHYGIKYSSREEDFEKQTLGVSGCEFLIARLGSIMVSSAMEGGRRMNVYPEIHAVVAYASQILPDLKDAIKAMKKKYGNRLPSMITNISGPSRTADIEKTLVMGAHGPKELFLFLIEDRNLNQ